MCDKNTINYSDTSIPSWLETSPSSQINPPVNTRKQDLPFDQLSWEDFERLCLRLVRLEANGRLRTDNKLFTYFNEKLQKNPSPAEKANIPKLIVATKGLSGELREWRVQELDHQLSKRTCPEISIDLFSGEILPVAYSLLYVLDQTSETNTYN